MTETQTITIEQAINNISLVLNAFKGTLKEHQVIQQSLKLLVDSIPKSDS